MTLYVLRHGETAWSKARKHTGRTDIPLTDQGRAQAARVATLLSGLHGSGAWAKVFTSPLHRAADTASLAGFPAATVDSRLLEWDYGDYDGSTTDEIRRGRPGWVLWRDGCPNGESAADVGERVDAVLAGVRCVDGDVLLVAHSHLLRVLTARWLGLPPEGGRMFVLDAAGVGVLGEEHGASALLHWNLIVAP